MHIQWFPGHMTKTKRFIAEDIKLVDIVIELVDARIPLSSKNPDINTLVGQKPRLLVMNKSDMADDNVSRRWEEYFRANNTVSVSVDSISGKGFPRFFDAVKLVMKEKIERDKLKGYVNKSIKMMIVGVPNVGKSSFINKIAKKSSTKTGDRPGVTKGKQWIRIDNTYELLDTPGILWPKFEDQSVGIKLAFTGAIKDEIIDIEELACLLIGTLRTDYADNLKNRYKLEDYSELTDYEVLERIARKRGFLLSGGTLDTHRAAVILMDEFRGTVLGKISLETPTGN